MFSVKKTKSDSALCLLKRKTISKFSVGAEKRIKLAKKKFLSNPSKQFAKEFSNINLSTLDKKKVHDYHLFEDDSTDNESETSLQIDKQFAIAKCKVTLKEAKKAKTNDNTRDNDNDNE